MSDLGETYVDLYISSEKLPENQKIKQINLSLVLQDGSSIDFLLKPEWMHPFAAGQILTKFVLPITNLNDSQSTESR